jgi:hypothetical protein
LRIRFGVHVLLAPYPRKRLFQIRCCTGSVTKRLIQYRFHQ